MNCPYVEYCKVACQTGDQCAVGAIKQNQRAQAGEVLNWVIVILRRLRVSVNCRVDLALKLTRKPQCPLCLAIRETWVRGWTSTQVGLVVAASFRT
jgi:hypothetical protein